MNILFNSLAGCGKSYHLIKFAQKVKCKNQNFIYLSFNRSIRNEIIRKTEFSNKQVHTFHSLAYNDLISNEKLDINIFKDIAPDDMKQYFDEYQNTNGNKKNNTATDNTLSRKDLILRSITGETLNKLLKAWCKNANFSQYKNLKYIFVDELQDLNAILVKMLKILYKLNGRNNVKIIAAGDQYQNIYSFLNDGRLLNNFERFGKYFGEYQTKELVKCYRSSASIQRFINGFYKINYNQNRYFDLSKYKAEEFTDDVFIHIVQHHHDFPGIIQDIINKHAGKKIKILSRVNKELEFLFQGFKQIFKDSPISDDLASSYITHYTSTIFGEKGNEYDIIIIINAIFNDKVVAIEDKNVWNVAITRAKEKLYILSSFPKEIILQKFEHGTYILKCDQITYPTFHSNSIIEKGIYLTPSKVNKSMIDSIIIQYSYDGLNCVPHEMQNITKYCKFKTDTMMTIKNMEFVLHRQNERLSFDFCDLNQLKNNKFSDGKIITYLTEIIKEYFHFTRSDEEINSGRISRLDLAKLFEVDSPDILFYIELFFKLSRYRHAEKKVKQISNSDSFATIYLNSNSKIVGDHTQYTNGIRVYFPHDKPNKNRLRSDRTLLKIEIYRKKGFYNLENTLTNLQISELSEIIDQNNLDRLFYIWLYHEFPYLNDGSIPNIELHKKNKGIYSLDQLINIINAGNIAIRDKKIYFFMLLDFLHENDRNDIKKIFKL